MANASSDALQSDFLNEGADLADYSQPQAPAGMDPAEWKRRRKEWLANQGLDENGNALPAYGTRQEEGGTAAQYGVTAAGTGVSGGSFDSGTGQQTRSNKQQYTVDYINGPNGTGGDRVPSLEEVSAPVDEAANDRSRQTTDLVNRYSAIQMDTGPADQARQLQQKALGSQQAIYDKLMAYDPAAEAQAASKRAMARTLTAARSGGGGAAARQAAQFQALQQSPSIQAEAANTANEQQARNVQQAAQVAAGMAQTAAGTRSQDIQQAQAETDTGLSIANGVANVVGHDIQLTSDEARFLSQAQQELAKLNLDWASLDERQREAKADEAMQKAGLDQQWKMFKKSQEHDFLDYLGALTGTARSGVQTYAAGKQSGLWG